MVAAARPRGLADGSANQVATRVSHISSRHTTPDIQLPRGLANTVYTFLLYQWDTGQLIAHYR